MKKWFSYTFIGVLVLAGGLFAYHFYAANDAEQKLDESIRKITSDADLGLTVSYSSIDVNPFSGDVVFSDVNIIREEDIQRTKSARFDLNYSDFVNITLWGTEYGLRHIEYGILELANLSYTNRVSLVEVKMDSLNVNYRGNLWNLIVLGITRSPARIRHKIDAAGTRFTFSHPGSGIGLVKADSLELQTHFGRQPADPDSLTSTASLSGITWSPPKPLQERYSFFIQGFGYETDSIPFKRLTASYRYLHTADTLAVDQLVLVSDLFETHASGKIGIDRERFSRSRLNEVGLKLTDLSPRFRNFLTNAERLFGVRIPMNDEGLSFTLSGSLFKPGVNFQTR